MSSSSDQVPKLLGLFVESSTGVTECILGRMNGEDSAYYSPISARVVSGKGSNLRPKNIQEALDLHQWAYTHARVFTEGVVVEDDK